MHELNLNAEYQELQNRKASAKEKKTIYDIIFQSGIIMMVHIGIGFIQPRFIVVTVLEYKI